MYEIYCRIRDEKGMKDSQVATIANIPKSTFTDWKKGKSKPKTEKLQKIADALAVPLPYLQTGDASVLVNEFVKELQASQDEMELVRAYRKADSLTQQMVLRLLGLEKEESLQSLKEA